MVSAYFKNIGQTKTLIQLIQERSEIQETASREMKEKFAHYNLELEEVLIGTPSASENDKKIEIILAQLRDRQIAVEQIETYTQQERAAGKEKELREAEAKAQQQTFLTQSEINIEIESNQGKAEYQKSLQQAQKIKAIAEAEAEKEAKVGIGRAIAIEEQVKAYGGPQYQVIQDIMNKFTAALESAKIDIVPKTVVNMGGGEQGSSANAFEMLLGLLISEKLGVKFDPEAKEVDPRVKSIKDSIMQTIAIDAEKATETAKQEAAAEAPAAPAATAAKKAPEKK
jgi:uncharacterized membrane protein YqiK